MTVRLLPLGGGTPANNCSLRVQLHQTSESMLRQCCEDASDTVLIENKSLENGLQLILEQVHCFQ